MGGRVYQQQLDLRRHWQRSEPAPARQQEFLSTCLQNWSSENNSNNTDVITIS